MARNYGVWQFQEGEDPANSLKEAVVALNTLQTNFTIINAIRKSGKPMNNQAIPEMIEWCRKAGYEPQDLYRLNPIHIAGTKGKGSTAAFVSSVLAQYLAPSSQHPRVKKVGLYTSPHLRFVRERIQINNEPLSEEMFAKYFFEVWDRLEESARRAGQPTDTTAKPVYFRFLTLMAFHTFMSEGVEPAIFECGIGGEYDSTNVLVNTPVAGITSLGIDHTALLGNTVESIAWHKAGIMKQGTKALTAPQSDRALMVLRDRAVEKKAALSVVRERHPEIAHEDVKLGLAADFQKGNASLAVAIAETFLGDENHRAAEGESDFSHASEVANAPRIGSQHNILPNYQWTKPLPPQFRKGLEEARWGGRCEIRKEPGVDWHIDGGHTLESIKLSGKWFATQINGAFSGGPARAKRVLVFNQQTRDAAALAKALYDTLAEALGKDKPFTHAVFCTNVTYKEAGYRPDLVSMNTNASDVQALSVQRNLADTWAKIDPGTEVAVKPTIEEAVDLVRSIARNQEDHTTVMALVTGSLHLVGGFLEVFETGSSSA